MKELTIEQKAQRYDEAIERYRAKQEYESQKVHEFIEYLFPELKESEESEDERIRKGIISYLKSSTAISPKTWIAWLEKQGNLMKALQISNARIGELIEENYYLREQLEKQGENNMGISEATKQELEDTLNKALEKETPESFNEFLDEQKPADTEKEAKGNDREIPNSAWSEEDKRTLQGIICEIEANKHYAPDCDLATYDWFLSWLKSLKDRYTWKPSCEQIIALRWVLNNIPYNKHKEEISGLLDQIKEL